MKTNVALITAALLASLAFVPAPRTGDPAPAQTAAAENCWSSKLTCLAEAGQASAPVSRGSHSMREVIALRMAKDLELRPVGKLGYALR